MEKQKIFNSKAQKLRRLKSDLSISGNSGNLGEIKFIDRPNLVRMGRNLRNSSSQEINIHKSINNKNLSMDSRKSCALANRVSRKMKKISTKFPEQKLTQLTIPRLKIR